MNDILDEADLWDDAAIEAHVAAIRARLAKLFGGYLVETPPVED